MVHRNCTTYVPERGSFRGWLWTVTANRCREILRARGRQPALNARSGMSDADLNALEDPPDDDRNPEVTVHRSRLREIVARFAAKLSGDERAMLRLGFAEERSHEEIAATLGATVRQCKYLKKKVLARALSDPELQAAMRELEETP